MSVWAKALGKDLKDFLRSAWGLRKKVCSSASLRGSAEVKHRQTKRECNLGSVILQVGFSHGFAAQATFRRERSGSATLRVSYCNRALLQGRQNVWKGRGGATLGECNPESAIFQALQRLGSVALRVSFCKWARKS